MSNLDTGVRNTPYSDEELEHFKKLLKQEKKKSRQEKKHLQDSVKNLGTTDDDTASSQAHHSGNIATEEEEKETLYSLIQKEDEKISKINAALDRIENKNYGVCQETGKKIQKERLEAVPYAMYSVEAKKKDDRHNPSPKV